MRGGKVAHDSAFSTAIAGLAAPFSARDRRRLRERSGLVLWHLRGRPSEPELARALLQAPEADEASDVLVTRAAGWKLRLSEDRSIYAGVFWHAARLTKQFEAVALPPSTDGSLGWFSTEVEAAICVARHERKQKVSSLPVYGPLPAHGSAAVGRERRIVGSAAGLMPWGFPDRPLNVASLFARRRRRLRGSSAARKRRGRG